MRGIDISNWQAGIKPSLLGIDFCICKATEGLGFIDKYCDGFIEDCKKNNILWGFYHFARENNPEKEAQFFYKHCKGYFGHGVPVLDYEVENASNREWCECFLTELHKLSGVWAMLYISASRSEQYRGSWIPQKCGLWLAGYPQAYTSWISGDSMPYGTGPWDFAAIWQFTSSLRLGGYELDGDIAYMDAKAWARYAGSTTSGTASEEPKKNTKTTDELAYEVYNGKHGTGEERKKSLGARYDEVQKRVNELFRIADEVINGKWGNGWNRQQALEGAGYPYELVQRIVNDKLD